MTLVMDSNTLVFLDLEQTHNTNGDILTRIHLKPSAGKSMET